MVESLLVGGGSDAAGLLFVTPVNDEEGWVRAGLRY